MRWLDGRPFDVIDVAADGHCLFRAFSHGLIQSDAAFDELRRTAVAEVCSDWPKYQMHTQNDKEEPFDNPETYACEMLREYPACYGGEAELHALSTRMACTVFVYVENTKVVEYNAGMIDVIWLQYSPSVKHYRALLPSFVDDPKQFEEGAVDRSGMIGSTDHVDRFPPVLPDLSSGSEDSLAESDELQTEHKFSTLSSASSESLFGSEAGARQRESATRSEASSEDLFGSDDDEVLANDLESRCIGSRVVRPLMTARPLKSPEADLNSKPSRALSAQTMQDTYMWARLYSGESTSEVKPLTLGRFDVVCGKCGARFWHAERLCGSADVPAWCCGKETHVLLSKRALFDPIRDHCVRELYFGNSEDAVHFRRHARAYNAVLSVGMPSVRHERRQVRTEYVLAVNGKVSFAVPTTHTVDPDGLPAQPGQLYFVDMTEGSVAKRISCSTDRHIRPHIVACLERYLRENNAFIRTFQLAKDIIAVENEVSGNAVGEGRRENLHLLVNPHRDGFRVTDRALFEEDGEAMRPPRSEFVAAVFEGDQPRYSYDVAFFPREVRDGCKPYTLVNEASPCIDNLLYVLVHLHAEESWVTAVRSRETERKRRREDWVSEPVGTIRQYYSSRVLRRGDDTQKLLFCLRGLYQEYLCSAAVKIEDSNLRYAESNQDMLMVCQYEGLKRYVQGVAEDLDKEPGRVIILPRNRQRSERRMHNHYIDAVTISARTGRPGFLITLTANPRWPEIVEQLADVGLAPQDYVHAPDIVVRAFEARRNALLGDIVGKGVLGRVLSYVGVIEFTQSFLPHYHLVVIVAAPDRPSTSDDLDATVCAEIPDINEHPELHRLVLNVMMHRPCDTSSTTYKPTCRAGSDGKCRFGFPFKFSESSFITGKAPVLRRRPTPAVWHAKWKCYVDNRWVVPFNPRLLLRYQCHLNTMICGDDMNWPYLMGYVTKESSGQMVQGSMLKFATSRSGQTLVWDEIDHYRTLRMMGAYESVFHILGLSFVDKSHRVVALPVHVPGKHHVYYRGVPSNIEDLEGRSQLLAWFRLNAENLYGTRDTLYADIVERFAYEKGEWRKKSGSNVIGRLMHVVPSPRNMELFHLRLLLLNRPGMVSFDDILTVDGTTYGTFKEAAEGLGLSDSTSIDYTEPLQEVVREGSAWQLRRFFAVLAALCSLSEVQKHWLDNREAMSRDFVRRGSSQQRALRLSRESLINQYALLLEAEKESREERTELLLGFRRSLTLPFIENGVSHELVPSESENMLDESAVDGHGTGDEASDPCTEFEQLFASYTDEQRTAHNQVMAAVLDPKDGACFFGLEAPAGCGKTYLYNGLLMDCKRRGLSTVPSAMTAIAALLMPDADTCNKCFGLPVRNFIDGTENTWLETWMPGYKALKDASLIVVDEVSMMARWQVEIIDRLLRSVAGKPSVVFGGKVILFGGDMGQILPVMRGVSSQVVAAHSLPAWSLWHTRQRLQLTINMRALADPELAEWLARVRDGTANDKVGCDDIKLPAKLVVIAPTENLPTTKSFRERRQELAIKMLVDQTFGDFSDDRMASSVLLAPTNAAQRDLNDRITARLPGQATTYFARTLFVEEVRAPPTSLHPDVQEAPVESDANGFGYVQEELDRIERGNLPPHRLVLKVGCIVMLLRNFCKKDGLCNGTRLKVVKLLKNTVVVQRIVAFRGVKDTMFLPKMWLRTDDARCVGAIQRFQFPVAPAAAITICKSQGQTFQHVGVYLLQPVFAHGQFYVAVGRAQKAANLKILVVQGPRQGVRGAPGRGEAGRTYTKNIVDRKVLQ